MIRTATLNDLHEIMRIEQLCFNKLMRFDETNLRYLITKGKGAFLVDEIYLGGKCVMGYAYLQINPKSLYARIYSLAVHPVAQRMKIAATLVKECESITTKKGLLGIKLEIERDNKIAACFYEKMGYDCVGTRADYYATKRDALLYKKELLECQTIG